MPRLGKPATEGELCPSANEQQRAKGNDGLKLFLSFDYAGLARNYRQLTPQNEFLSLAATSLTREGRYAIVSSDMNPRRRTG